MFSSIKYIFKLFALPILCFPSLSTAGDSWQSGDWSGPLYDLTIAIINPSQGLSTSYLVCFQRDEDSIVVKNHSLIGNINNLEISNQVTFKFDNSTSIIVPVAGIDDLSLKRGNDIKAVRFLPWNDITNLENYIKTGSSFSIYVGEKMLFGPFSLKGSRKAVNGLNAREKGFASSYDCRQPY